MIIIEEQSNIMNEENHQPAEIPPGIEELTRQKIVRQLHDGLTQTVSALAMRINYARRLIDVDPQSAGEELEKVEDLTRAATKEIRHIIFMLRPENLDHAGLVAELETLADKMADLFSLELELEIDEFLVNRCSAGQQEVIYRMVEELVDNVRMLTDERRFVLGIKQVEGDFAQLQFVDNISQDRGEGAFKELILENIQPYADLIDGTVMLSNDGNQVQVIFPLDLDYDPGVAGV